MVTRPDERLLAVMVWRHRDDEDFCARVAARHRELAESVASAEQALAVVDKRLGLGQHAKLLATPSWLQRIVAEGVHRTDERHPAAERCDAAHFLYGVIGMLHRDQCREEQPLGVGGTPSRSKVLQRLRLADALFRTLTRTAAVAVLILLGGVIVSLVIGSLPALRTYGVGFLTTEAWNPVTESFSPELRVISAWFGIRSPRSLSCSTNSCVVV